MFKKYLFLSMVLVFVLSSLTLAAEQTVVEFWHGFQSGRVHEAMNEMVKHFEETHPNIKIKQTLVAWGKINDKVLTSVAAGNPPDVARGWSANIAWASQGALESLDEFIKDDPEWNPEDFWPQAIEQSTYEGKIYAVSPSVITNVMFYNKDRFREVGLDPEDPPNTIEELEEMNEKLTVAGDNGEIEKIGIVPTISAIDNWIYAFGGKLYDHENKKITANHPKNIEAFKWLKSFIDNYGVENIQAWIASNQSGQFGRWNPQGPYYTGELGMWVIGQWNYNDIMEYGKDMDFGMTYIPSPDGWPNTSSRLNSNFYYMPKGAKHPEAAWEFLKFLSGEYFMRHFVATDAVTPARKGICYDEEFVSNNPWIVPVRDKLMPNSRAIPNSLPIINEYHGQLNAALDMVVFGEKTAEEALNALQAEMEKELKRALE